MGAGLTRSYDVDVSQTISAGDIVVLNNANSTVRVCKLTTTMIGAHYTNTSVAGLLGVAKHDVKTDSTGAPVGSVTPPSTVAAGAAPTYPLPSYASGIDTDPVTGNARLEVQVFNSDSEFFIRAQASGNAAVTVSSTKIGLPIGIQIYNTVDFASNESATGSDVVGEVTMVNETDPFFNTSSAQCKYLFSVKPAYQQYLTGIYYAAAT